MNGAAFDTYISTQLAPTLKPDDVVIFDNLNVHKNPRAAQAIGPTVPPESQAVPTKKTS